LPLVVALHNSGVRDVTGTLTINGLGDPIVTPDFAAAVGGAAQTVVAIEPDLLPAGEVPIEVIYATGTGQVLAQQGVGLTILPAAPAIVSAPQFIEAAAGGVTPVEFFVANGGSQTAVFELSLAVNGGALFSGRQEGRLRGGQQQAVRFDVPLAADLPSSRLQAEYALIRVEPTGDDGTTVGNGRFRFSVQGVPVNVTAQLDHDHVGAGGAIALTLTLDGSQLTTPCCSPGVVPPFDERREFELGPAGTEVRFEVPIEQPGAELGYGIYFPSGRALYLDALTIHPAGRPVEISASQREYRPGDQVQLAVTLNQPGVFEAYGFEHDASLSASGGATFQVPAGLPQGRYPILWTFYGSGPDGGVINGEYPVKVRGPVVRITRLHAVPRTDLAGQMALVEAEVTSDTFLPINLRAWLAAPSGHATFMGEMPLDLQPGEIHEGGLLLDLSDAERAHRAAWWACGRWHLADAAAPDSAADGARVPTRFYRGGRHRPALVDVQGRTGFWCSAWTEGGVARSVV
jgi:hypothetical protein